MPNHALLRTRCGHRPQSGGRSPLTFAENMKRFLLCINFLAYLVSGLMAAAWWIARHLAMEAKGLIDLKGILICGVALITLITSIFIADIL